MRTLLSFIALLVSFTAFADDKKYTEAELEQKAKEIKNEGMLLYRYEKASWLAGDMMMAKYTGDKSRIKGYFPYIDDGNMKCVFFDNTTTGISIIATFTFDMMMKPTGADYTERQPTARELDYSNLRASVGQQLTTDTFLKYYQNANFNMISVIDDNRRDIYLITATSQTGNMLLGNDYLYHYDKNNKLVSREALHSALIPIPYGSDEQKGEKEGSAHTHLPEYSPFITPTDICTAMLYKEYTNHFNCVVASANYLSIFHIDTQTLVITPYNKD